MSDETTDLTELKDAVRAGLRKCRHEEAPIPIIRDADLFHITHMVATEVAAAGFGPVRAVQAERDAARAFVVEAMQEAGHDLEQAWARAESAEAALAGLREGIEALAEFRMPFVPIPCWTPDQEAAAIISHGAANLVYRRALEALLAPTPDREEAACSDWPSACQHAPAHDNGKFTPDREEARDE